MKRSPESPLSSTRPRFSVVMPNMNGAATIREALEAVFSTGYQDREVIVVDDASTDGSPDIAAQFPVRLIKHDVCQGASASRNDGARAATGEIILFIDADVVIPPRTFSIMGKRFNGPGVSAVIGLLQPITRFGDFCSQYKNFYMHYTYMKLPDQVTVFYTSIAAIRREAFHHCGGFDTAYRGATIEDMDFGLRVTGHGYRIELDKRLQVEHLKKYRLPGLLKTGFRRASGLAKIMLRDRLRRRKPSTYHTTSPTFTGGMVVSFMTVFFLALSLIFSRWIWLLPAAVSYLTIIGLNFGFLAGLARATRPAFFIGGCGLIFVDLLAHGCGVCWGVLTFIKGRKY